VTIAATDHLRAEFNANAWSGRLQGWLSLAAGLFPSRRETGPSSAAYQSASRPVRAGGLDRANQTRTKALATRWLQSWIEAAKERLHPQRACHCAGPQARPHRVDGSQHKVRQNRCDGVLPSEILAPLLGVVKML
jgi:hypothetical protein